MCVLLSCVLKYMDLYHTSLYYSAVRYLILLNLTISISYPASCQPLLCHIILSVYCTMFFYVYTILKHLVLHILNLHWPAFRTNCDYLIGNCKSPLPCHEPQPNNLRFPKSLLKKHLLSAIKIAILYFSTSSEQEGRC